MLGWGAAGTAHPQRGGDADGDRHCPDRALNPLHDGAVTETSTCVLIGRERIPPLDPTIGVRQQPDTTNGAFVVPMLPRTSVATAVHVQPPSTAKFWPVT